jgi:hypothetical protein
LKVEKLKLNAGKEIQITAMNIEVSDTVKDKDEGTMSPMNMSGNL